LTSVIWHDILISVPVEAASQISALNRCKIRKQL